MNNLVEISKDKQVVTTSVRVAEVFGKRHDNILRQINTLIGSLREQQDFTHLKNEVSTVKYAVGEYADSTGRKLKQYIMNRDGFTLLAMGFTGPKALKFKLQYIQAFNDMEARLKAIYPCGMDSRVKHGNDNREVKHGNDYDKPVEVVAHTRSLPSGKKEIVLSEKAKAEIGGIVKNCLAAALEAKRPEMSGSSPRMTTEIDYQKLAAGVGGWVSMTLMSARYDDLRLEAESLRKRAALCEKQAEEVMKSVKKIESAFGI